MHLSCRFADRNLRLMSSRGITLRKGIDAGASGRPRKHIVLTLGRSGSNTLVDLLNQHPEILNYGEALGDWSRLRKLQRASGLFKNEDAAYLDALLGNRGLQRFANVFRNLSKAARADFTAVKRIARLQTIGVKEFSLNLDNAGLGSYLAERPDIQVIGLVRSNILARAVSSGVLEQTGVVRTGSPRPKKQAGVKLEAGQLLRALEAVENENARLLEVLNSLDPARVHMVFYEEAFASHATLLNAVRKAYAFLGVPDHLPEIRQFKLRGRDPLAMLSNRNDLQKVLSGTRYAHFLQA